MPSTALFANLNNGLMTQYNLDLPHHYTSLYDNKLNLDIENDMNLCYKAVYNIDKGQNVHQKSARRKRQELSISATKKLNTYIVNNNL